MAAHIVINPSKFWPTIFQLGVQKGQPIIISGKAHKFHPKTSAHQSFLLVHGNFRLLRVCQKIYAHFTKKRKLQIYTKNISVQEQKEDPENTNFTSTSQRTLCYSPGSTAQISKANSHQTTTMGDPMFLAAHRSHQNACCCG